MPNPLLHWQALANSDPDLLITELLRGTLPPWELSFAAEVAGCLPAARTALLALLDHKSPTVREGAIYGLSKQLTNDPVIHARLTTIADHDRSGAVRESALEALSLETVRS
jgi:HEAT repeat protein